MIEWANELKLDAVLTTGGRQPEQFSTSRSLTCHLQCTYLLGYLERKCVLILSPLSPAQTLVFLCSVPDLSFLLGIHTCMPQWPGTFVHPDVSKMSWHYLLKSTSYRLSCGIICKLTRISQKLSEIDPRTSFMNARSRQIFYHWAISQALLYFNFEIVWLSCQASLQLYRQSSSQT